MAFKTRAPGSKKTRNAGRKNAGSTKSRGKKTSSTTLDNEIRLFGIHAVLAALENPARKILQLQLTENALKHLDDAIEARGLDPHKVTTQQLDAQLGKTTVHQGVLLTTRALPALKLEDLEANGPIIVLDQVTDPHNVGAVLRSAAVFGAAALLFTKRNSPHASGVLGKAASGGLEHVPLIEVTNLARSLDALGSQGFTRIGLDGLGQQTLEGVIAPNTDDPLFADKIALVFGAEGRGLRRLTMTHCDHICRIDTSGPLRSLNVSNAVAISLHIASHAGKNTS